MRGIPGEQTAAIPQIMDSHVFLFISTLSSTALQIQVQFKTLHLFTLSTSIFISTWISHTIVTINSIFVLFLAYKQFAKTYLVKVEK